MKRRTPRSEQRMLFVARGLMTRVRPRHCCSERNLLCKPARPKQAPQILAATSNHFVVRVKASTASLSPHSNSVRIKKVSGRTMAGPSRTRKHVWIGQTNGTSHVAQHYQQLQSSWIRIVSSSRIRPVQKTVSLVPGKRGAGAKHRAQNPCR